jgi:hypothetical protein
MDWRQWQPEPGRFTWDSPEMRILDRILTWADRHGSDVMLQCMWLNVEWLAFPEYCGDPALTHASAPADLDAYANSWVTLLQELITKRGHTCIRWINLVNEPNFYWWLIPPDTGARQDRGKQAAYLAEAMNKVRTAITAANLPVKLMGPDFTDLPVFENISNEPWFAVVDDVDFHSYCSCFDWEDPKQQPASWAYRMGERLEQTLVKYRAETTAAGKGLYLTEFGTQTYGYAADDPAPEVSKPRSRMPNCSSVRSTSASTDATTGALPTAAMPTASGSSSIPGTANGRTGSRRPVRTAIPITCWGWPPAICPSGRRCSQPQ